MSSFTALAVAALGIVHAVPASAQQEATQKAFCPTFGWAEGLWSNFQQPNSQFPVNDTKPNPNKPNDPIPDCNFHMWSFEAFVWATTLNKQNVPRFMTLPTEEDLLSPLLLAGTVHPRTLQLAARSTVGHDLPGYSEGAGAFVQADGNVLVAPNGYPVYTSVHMNPTYFATARKNLIATGDYQKGQPNDTFPLGSAVFKATWLRLATGEPPPAGAFVTQAQVPVLTVQRSHDGYHHPAGAEQVRDRDRGAGRPACGRRHRQPSGISLGHLRAQPQHAASPRQHLLGQRLQLRPATRSTRPTPRTGRPTIAVEPPLSDLQYGDAALLAGHQRRAGKPDRRRKSDERPRQRAVGELAGAGFSAHEKGDKECSRRSGFFQLLSGRHGLDAAQQLTISTATRATRVGSVNLANTTAETFQQFPSNADMSKVQNCFMCHNASSYSFQSSPPPLNNRLVAISHALSVGTDYAVPNMISGNVRMLFFKGQ